MKVEEYGERLAELEDAEHDRAGYGDSMKTREEIEEELATHQEWLHEWEGLGAAEEGAEIGWVMALEWVLGQEKDR